MPEWRNNAPTQAQPLHAKGWPSARESSATRAARRTPAQAAPGSGLPPLNPRASDAAARALVCLGSPARVERVCTTPSCRQPWGHSGLHPDEASKLQPTRTCPTPSSRLASSTGLGAVELDLVAKLVDQHAATPLLLHSLAIHVSSYRNKDDAAHRELVRAFLSPAVPENLPYGSFWSAVALMDLKHGAAPRGGGGGARS